MASSDEAREKIYGILEVSLTHPDGGSWGQLVLPDAQRRAIAASDWIRGLAMSGSYERHEGEGPARDLDLRALMVDLCQPLGQLKLSYERVICMKKPRPGCSPFALDHRKGMTEKRIERTLEELKGLYRDFEDFDASEGRRRADHVACEMGFMRCLIERGRMASVLRPIDGHAAEESARCGLAQRDFFGNHLTGWLVDFAAGLQRNARSGYFETLGRFLAAWAPFERHYLGIPAEAGAVAPRGKRRRVSLAS
ncbi:TorD/DmsD family molecular chaperone [Aquisphaera insulae]|uniref:TorD/DmsD family molecular chaperone n=1 Tax=Aquisphaera insulae TaxID=2712864 RepID=UPI0013EC8244|nr:molecular chaperone TorD family protein [Aquisphaera insulae]